MLGLCLLFLSGSALLDGDGSLPMWLLLGLSIMLLTNTGGSDKPQQVEVVSEARRPATATRQQRSRSSQSNRAPAHADRAVRQAGHNPANMNLRVSDIGIVSMREGHEPLVHREVGVEEDADYIQPWVELHVPGTAAGTLRFELRDADGQLRFVRDRKLQLRPGKNFVSPTARLPVRDDFVTDGDWLLSIHADGDLLAQHRFAWLTGGARMNAHLREDGEMSEELRQAFEESAQEQELSLDELLDFQQGQTR